MSQVHSLSQDVYSGPQRIDFVSIGVSHITVESSQSVYLASHLPAVMETWGRKLLGDSGNSDTLASAAGGGGLKWRSAGGGAVPLILCRCWL